MGTLSIPNTFSANTTISSSEVNANFSTIYNEFNGSIEAANLATNAVVEAKIADNAVTAGKIASNAVTTAKILDANVTAPKLATSAIYLGHVSKTDAFTTASSSAVQITDVSVTVTVPSGGRKVKVTLMCPSVYSTGSAGTAETSIWEGTVGSGTKLTAAHTRPSSVSLIQHHNATYIYEPSAGEITYNAGASSSAGTTNVVGASTSPIQLIVELI